MPKPSLTDAQRPLLDYINKYKIHEGKPIDSTSFGKLMLRPAYVDMVRRDLPEISGAIGDSAAWYDRFRSPVSQQAPLSGEYLPPPPAVSSSQEGTYDTLRYPAYGDQPAQQRVVFRPSTMQRAKDAAGEVKSFGSHLIGDLVSRLPTKEQPNAFAAQPATDTSFGNKLLSGLQPTSKLQSLYDFIAGKPNPYDAVTGAAAKPTRLQKDGL